MVDSLKLTDPFENISDLLKGETPSEIYLELMEIFSPNYIYINGVPAGYMLMEIGGKFGLFCLAEKSFVKLPHNHGESPYLVNITFLNDFHTGNIRTICVAIGGRRTDSDVLGIDALCILYGTKVEVIQTPAGISLNTAMRLFITQNNVRAFLRDRFGIDGTPLSQDPPGEDDMIM